MDFFGIRMYIEQKRLQYSKWLKTERGVYTNKDVVVDVLQIVIIVMLIGLDILK